MNEPKKSALVMSVSPSPVQMVSPKIMSLSIKCPPDLIVSEEEKAKLLEGLQIDVNHGFGFAETGSKKIPFGQMSVSMSPEKNPGRVLPYEISITVRALFQVPDTVPEDEQVNLATTWGWSQLYGFLRSAIESITAQAPLGSITLPAMQVNIIDVNALEATISGLEREINLSPQLDKKEIAAFLVRTHAIERAIHRSKGLESIDKLASKNQALKEKLEALKTTGSTKAN